MKIIEPGHIYELDHLDGKKKQRLTFVNREDAPHEGTQTQEVLRAVIDSIECLIDRTNHCDACLRWEGNDKIVKALTEAQRQCRLALLFHEARAMERKLEKGALKPERIPVNSDGHFQHDSKLTIDLRLPTGETFTEKGSSFFDIERQVTAKLYQLYGSSKTAEMLNISARKVNLIMEGHRGYKKSKNQGNKEWKTLDKK